MGTGFKTDRSADILRISPAVASKWLDRNTSNRPLSAVYVNELAAAMKRGEWMENGEAIKFSKDGVLLDGQHRLAAVIASSVAIVSRVEYGLPPEAFITLDRGKKRNLGDALAMDGVTEHTLVAAAVTVVWQIRNEAWSNRQPTPMQLLEFYENECGGIVDSIPPTRSASKMSRGSTVVALHFLFSRHSRRLADEFMALVGSGANMEAGHPVLVLRDRLIADRMAKASLPRIEIVAMFIRAWNAFVGNRTLRTLKGTIGDSGIPKIEAPVWTGDEAAS